MKEAVVIDTSALIAVLEQEEDARKLLEIMAGYRKRIISAATLLEASIVIRSRRGEEGERDLDLLIMKLSIETEAVTATQAELARIASARYGKGKHAAGLNYGDCFSYALAAESGYPLLFKGSDFSRTDVVLAD